MYEGGGSRGPCGRQSPSQSSPGQTRTRKNNPFGHPHSDRRTLCFFSLQSLQKSLLQGVQNSG